MKTSIETPPVEFQSRQFVFHINSEPDAARLSALLSHPAVSVYLFGDTPETTEHKSRYLSGQSLTESFKRSRAEYAGNLDSLIASTAPGKAPSTADPAAIMAIACSLNEAGGALNKAEETNGDVGEAYGGFDEYMRECMRLATEFETWCCEHGDFDNYESMWVYELDDFADELTKLHSTVALLNLRDIKADSFPALAAAFNLNLKTNERHN